MPSEVTFDETLQIIEIVHTGILQKATDSGLATVTDTGVTNVLIDTSNLESVEDMAAIPTISANSFQFVEFNELPLDWYESALGQ